MHRFAKQTSILALFAALALGFAACDSSGGTTGKADTAAAASVNGTKIMMGEVEKKVDAMIKQMTGGQQVQLSSLQVVQARLQVLENLIQRQVLVQRAEKENTLPSEDDINAYINSQKTNMTPEEWEKFLKSIDQTEQSVREEARKDLAIRKLQEKVFGKITITEKQIEDYYKQNPAGFVNARGVGLSAVIVNPGNDGFEDDAKSEEEAKLKIDRLYAQLKGGADFADVARASSEDQTSYIRGGDLGFATEDALKRGGFPPEMINNFFNSMQIGSYTAPVKMSDGRWYIFKLTSKNMQNENLTLDSPGVRDRIKEALRNQQQELLQAALVTSAMHEAKIENYLVQNLLNDPNSVNSLIPPAATGASASPAAAGASPAAASSPAASPASSPTTAAPAPAGASASPKP